MRKDRYVFSGDELDQIYEICTRHEVSPETILQDRTRGGEPHPVIRTLAESFQVHYARIENVLIGLFLQPEEI